MYSGFPTLLPYAAATLSGSDVACAGAPLVLPGAGFFLVLRRLSEALHVGIQYHI